MRLSNKWEVYASYKTRCITLPFSTYENACIKSGRWQILSILLMCLSFWFCYLTRDVLFWIFIRIRKFCNFTFTNSYKKNQRNKIETKTNILILYIYIYTHVCVSVKQAIITEHDSEVNTSVPFSSLLYIYIRKPKRSLTFTRNNKNNLV